MADPLRRAGSGFQGDQRAKTVADQRGLLQPGAYYDILRPHVAHLDMWETTFLHVLTGENAVTQWAEGSSLRPFLDALPDDLKQPFRDAYSDALRPHYPRRADGTTLLPFKRLFIVARL